MKITLSTAIAGRGALTAGTLRASLDALPDEARLTIASYDSQRDGSSWRLEAQWEEER